MEKRHRRTNTNASFCERQGTPGDCLGLFEDGPGLDGEDKRDLALALSVNAALESRDAQLRSMFSTTQLWTTLSLTLIGYMALVAAPEPATKGVAAALTVVLVAWLGVDTVWGLLDGWAELVMKARVATTFDELQEAGASFARVLGTDAARAMILAVTALSRRTPGEVATVLRSLPSFRLARLQLIAQGGPGWVLVQVERVREVAASAEGALAITVAPEGALAGAMMNRNSGAGSSSGGSPVNEVYRHRGGNRQVEVNGGRWHLPRGVSVHDIPPSDPLGDQLQAAAKKVAAQWGPQFYTQKVRAAIDRLMKRGLVHRAELLERQARGQWVEKELQKLFPSLDWRSRGVDVVGPSGQKYHYELLSGTDSNFELHGRRMASTFFRMIFF